MTSSQLFEFDLNISVNPWMYCFVFQSKLHLEQHWGLMEIGVHIAQKSPWCTLLCMQMLGMPTTPAQVRGLQIVDICHYIKIQCYLGACIVFCCVDHRYLHCTSERSLLLQLLWS